MPSSRKIIRAFLASPGDLEEEREAVRDAVDEFNVSWADELGYQVELVGWKETVAGFGRPQHLINQDLDGCDLFLGMLWKRWGSPPDNEGQFSSGFEEEFERSITRRETTGNPEISLFFKDIPDDFMVDPGDALKKVLDFRNEVTAGKKVLYQKFSNLRDMEVLARKCITAYVIRVRGEDESSEPDELRAIDDQSGPREDGSDRGGELSPLSAKGFEFLESLVDRIRQPDSLDVLTSSDVARFRLLANSISKPGNEKMNLGVHDINILFRTNIEGAKLGDAEIMSLARLGFQNLSNENVPLWRWYYALKNSQNNPAIFSSVSGGNDDEKVGAISVLTSLALDLSAKKIIDRERIISIWFSDNSSAKVRAAALGYLAKCGNAEDQDVVRKEYDRSDHETSRSALECMLGILLRTGQLERAQHLILELQFESLNDDLLMTVLDGIERLTTSDLLLGLEHRNSLVRLHAMKSLHARRELEIRMAERLSGDSNILVRSEAVAVLLGLGKQLTEREVKAILIQPKKQNRLLGLGLGTAAGSDRDGEAQFERYQLNILKAVSETELVKKVEANLIYDDAPYFALMGEFFKKHADELRRDVDDRFGAYFEERIRRMGIVFGDGADSQSLVKKTKDIEGILRKQLTRQGLDILCVAKKREDLQRIRANLRDGYAGSTKLDAKYLAKYGEWSDIPLLANAEGPKSGTSLLEMSHDDVEYQLGVGRAITSIGKGHSVTDLLSIEMPSAILIRVIELCPESRFTTIDQGALLALFNHKLERVRKATALLAVRSLTVKRIRDTLREYALGENYRYYNVIHWLDLGASMPRNDAKKVARSAAS